LAGVQAAKRELFLLPGGKNSEPCALS